MSRRLRSTFLGRVSYAEALHLQHRIRDEILNGDADDALLLLEHDPVYTLGRNAGEDQLRATQEWLEHRGIAVHTSDRGGQATYHGPGQLVGYPILNLNPDRRDIRRYVRDLQRGLIQTLAHYGIEAEGGEQQETIGVWVGRHKIGSIGVHLKRWVTTHGFALNVTTNLEDFGGILACGFEPSTMTSMEQLGCEPTLEDVASRFEQVFAGVFERELVPFEVAAGARP